MNNPLPELTKAVEPFGLKIDTWGAGVTRYRFYGTGLDRGFTAIGEREARVYVKGLQRGARGRNPNE
ncbi:hypothetical protein LCGC14_1022280 [marine sediment metagenome]|uniref:Uncharacterized protein n=1 Tax=marine sediment metagenome TaxID=412755 RepID=A0A0F9QF99_9ZZZZ